MKVTSIKLRVFAAAILVLSGSVSGDLQNQGDHYYVSPDGTAAGDGSIGDPWDLQTAFAHPDPVRPGDTIWLRGGTYTIRTQQQCYLVGARTRPITIRSFPGEQAIIDTYNGTTWGCEIQVQGSYTHWRDLEFTNSRPDSRVIDEDNVYYFLKGTNIDRGFGFNVYGGAETKLINSVIHDQSYASGWWSSASGGEMYGCVIYNNGWEGATYLQGTGLYMQNRIGHKRITDTIFFNNGRYGTNISGSNNAWVRDVTLSGNVYFNNGTNLFVGTYNDPADRGLPGIVITDNFFYNGQIWLGYQWSRMDRAIVERNWFIKYGYLPVLRIDNVSRSTELFESFRDNMIHGTVQGINTGFYPNNTYMTVNPPGEQVFIRPNRYEAGRANIIIYNWERKDSVPVNLARAGLKAGDRFELRDVQNYPGPPVLQGVYAGGKVLIPVRNYLESETDPPEPELGHHPGPVSIPMTNREVISAIMEPPGWRHDPFTGIPRDHTAPEFAVFVLRNIGQVGDAPD